LTPASATNNARDCTDRKAELYRSKKLIMSISARRKNSSWAFQHQWLLELT
jgi:hypothetical protein